MPQICLVIGGFKRWCVLRSVARTPVFFKSANRRGVDFFYAELRRICLYGADLAGAGDGGWVGRACGTTRARKERMREGKLAIVDSDKSYLWGESTEDVRAVELIP